jgi:phage terminase large subunit-like protein
MAAPTRDFCDLVLDGRFWHPGHPVLNSHAANTAVELDAAGNMKPTRKATYAPIDGIVSAIMALGRASQRPWEPLGESRTPGVRTI